jgi:Tfp pilus assembly protein FimT
LKKISAFTLIETMFCIALLSIMLTISMFAWVWHLQYTKERVLLHEAQHLMQMSQQESWIRGTPIAVCLSKNSYQCDVGDAKSILVFVNPKKDGIPNKAGLLGQVKVNNNENSFRLRSFPKSRKFLLLNKHQLFGDNATIFYCNQKTKKLIWKIKISQFGNISIT